MWVKKVTEGPIIRYGEGRRLEELAGDLRSCKETLGAINKLEEIDTRMKDIRSPSRVDGES